MAESTQRLTDTLKASAPQVGWRGIAAFRNVLTHNYLGVDLRQVWEIVERDVPVLKHEAETLLKGLQR